MRSSTYLLTYLLRVHSWLCVYKTSNISETVEDRAKATIDGLYKSRKQAFDCRRMYDLE